MALFLEVTRSSDEGQATQVGPVNYYCGRRVAAATVDYSLELAVVWRATGGIAVGASRDCNELEMCAFGQVI